MPAQYKSAGIGDLQSPRLTLFGEMDGILDDDKREPFGIEAKLSDGNGIAKNRNRIL